MPQHFVIVAESLRKAERDCVEPLLANFSLEDDVALSRLASVVHYLDVGGVPAPEAADWKWSYEVPEQRLRATTTYSNTP